MSSLRSNTLLFGLAVVLERLISFFLLPILTKIISPADYAIWTQSIVVVGVITPLILMGFQTALIKYFPLWESISVQRDSVLLAMLITIFALLTITSGLFLICSDSVAKLVYGDSRYKIYIPLLAGFLISETLYQFLIAILRATHSFKLISLYTVLKGAWRLGIFLLVLYGMRCNFYEAFIAFTFIQLVFIIMMFAKDVPYKRIFKSGLMAGREHWGETLSFSLPLVGLGVMTGLNNFNDRFFLTHFWGLDDVAAYSAAFSLVAVSAIFYSVLGLTLFPALSNLWSNNRHDDAISMVEKAIRLYLFFILPFIAGAVLAGQDLIVFLATKDYAVPSMVFLLSSSSVGLFGLYSIGNYVVLLKLNTLRIFGLMVLAALVNVLLNAVLVPYIGITGAALASFLSNAILASVTLYWSRKVLGWRFPFQSSIGIVFRTGIMIGFFCFAKTLFGTGAILWNLTILLLAGLLYLLLDVLDKRGGLLTLMGQS